MIRSRFTNAEWRHECRANARRIAAGLLNSQKSQKVDIRTGMMEFFTPEALKHENSPSFQFLCERLEEFLKDAQNWQENRDALKLAKDNFESYCDLHEKSQGMHPGST